jgi:hypothetical protein
MSLDRSMVRHKVERTGKSGSRVHRSRLAEARYQEDEKEFRDGTLYGFDPADTEYLAEGCMCDGAFGQDSGRTEQRHEERGGNGAEEHRTPAAP